MAYSINAENVSLDNLQKRIEETDLIPSRVSLLAGIQVKFEALKYHGILTLAQLRNELKNTRRLEALANDTAIDMEYLILLRREIESYFPKPIALITFDWLPKEEIAKLEEHGICDTAMLFKVGSSVTDRNELEKLAGVNAVVLEAIYQLVDLTRVQWVSPTVARMLVEADYNSPRKVADADAEDLCAALMRINEGDRFFKGKIGLRDVKRLIQAASYVLV